MDTAATAEAPTLMEAAPEATAIEATSAKATSPAIETTTAAEAAAIKTATVETAEPRARANKEAVYKVLWTIKPVRRAIIWVIAIITVSAHRSRTVVARANPNSKRNLRVRRGRRREHKDGQ